MNHTLKAGIAALIVAGSIFVGTGAHAAQPPRPDRPTNTNTVATHTSANTDARDGRVNTRP